MMSPVLIFISSLSGVEPLVMQKEAPDAQVAPPQHVKKTSKSYVREMDFITMPEFENIPQ